MDSQENVIPDGVKEELQNSEPAASNTEATPQVEAKATEDAVEETVDNAVQAPVATEEPVDNPTVTVQDTEQPEETAEQSTAEAEVVATETEVNTAESDTEEELPEEEVLAEEEQPAEEAPAEEETPDEEIPAEEEQPAEEAKQETAPRHYKTKKEILERVKEIIDNGDVSNKEEIEHLKTTFYKIHTAEREAAKKEYVDNGGDPEQYQYPTDEDETLFKAEMGVIREKRAEMAKVQDSEKQANLVKKLEIINKIKAMATSPEEANKSYGAFMELQQQWKEIKAVPAEKSAELWRNYQLYREQFYDLLKLNSEAREYDFRKNLEAKTKLCEAAEKLSDMPDVVSAFHQLQELHQQYRETGPVSKDLREKVWARFKAASTVINKRHQQHFEELRTKEAENLAKKTELCEKVEELTKELPKTPSEWEKRTRSIIALQAEWKKIGYAPQKMNIRIFERFRGVCDDFFGRKAAFFKEMKSNTDTNIAKKKELIEKAKELSTSTDWKSTSDKLIALQKEWKTVGGVPKKIGDVLWNDFLTACNTFFDARNAANGNVHAVERANLEKKRSIIAQLSAVLEEKADDAAEKVRSLIDEYNATGHVPYKEKDNIYKAYREIVDKLSKELGIYVDRRRAYGQRGGQRGTAKHQEETSDNERTRLMRRYEQLKQEAKTYENNIGFLNTSSEKGNSIVDEINKKVQKLKDEIEVVRQKIIAIDKQEEQEDNSAQ